MRTGKEEVWWVSSDAVILICVFNFQPVFIGSFLPFVFSGLIISKVEEVGQGLTLQFSFENSLRTKMLQFLLEPVPGLNHPHQERFLPYVPSSIPGRNSCYCPFTEHLWGESVSIYFITSPLGVEHLQLDFPFCLPSPSWFPQPLHVCHVLQPSGHLSRTPVDPIWECPRCPGDVDEEAGSWVHPAGEATPVEAEERSLPAACWLPFCHWLGLGWALPR